MPANSSFKPSLPSETYELTLGDISRAEQEHALGMVLPNDPVLTRKAELLTSDQIQTKHVKDVIAKLHEVAVGQRDVRKGKRRRTLVGLAAPQIGVSLRIILVDTKVQANRTRYGNLECFINPEIIWRAKETADGREGCFSTGLVWGLVRRPIAVKVRALTPEGRMVERVLEGFTARIMQHEMDHLDGVRFPDRIHTDRKRHWVHAEEIDEYPKHVKHWPRICDQARWERVKSEATPTQ
jgi:peptide deformylase